MATIAISTTTVNATAAHFGNLENCCYMVVNSCSESQRSRRRWEPQAPQNETSNSTTWRVLMGACKEGKATWLRSYHNPPEDTG